MNKEKFITNFIEIKDEASNRARFVSVLLNNTNLSKLNDIDRDLFITEIKKLCVGIYGFSYISLIDELLIHIKNLEEEVKELKSLEVTGLFEEME